MKALLICIMTMLTVGCANVNWKQDILGAGSVKLLYEEFTAAKTAVLSVEYTDPEKLSQMQDVVAELDRQRIVLGHLHEQNGTQIALTLPQAMNIYNSLRFTYVSGRNIYIAHLTENKLQPDPLLVQYDRTAQTAGNFIAEKINSGKQVMTGEIVNLLSMAFRMYAATKGIPMVERAPIELDGDGVMPAGAIAI